MCLALGSILSIKKGKKKKNTLSIKKNYSTADLNWQKKASTNLKVGG
jgi:hypothetical protein